MTMRFSTARRLTAVVAVAGVLAAAGCGGDEDAAKSGRPCPTEARNGLAVALGARANSPAPALPPILTDYLTDIEQEKGITIVRADGRPTIVCAARFHTDAKNAPAQQQARHNFGTAAFTQMRAVRAAQPEADPLSALSLAAAAAGPGGTVVLVDSGLQTVDPLNFGDKKTLFLPPDQIVARLREQNLLPDLSNRTVVLSGIGWTAPPQKLPHEGIRRRLVAIWTAIAQAGGGKVDVLPAPNTDPAVDGVPTVSTVKLPEPDPLSTACNAEVPMPDNGAVGFRPDEDVFREPDRAKATLLTVADWLTDNSTAKVRIGGTVAHHGENVKDSGLALDRAQAVRDTLAELGVSPGRMSARGDGWGPFPGSGDKIDQKNRRVVLRISC